MILKGPNTQGGGAPGGAAAGDWLLGVEAALDGFTEEEVFLFFNQWE